MSERARRLSPRSAAILRAAIAAIRPRGHGFDQPIDEDVLLEIDRTVPFFPATLRLAFPLGLRWLDATPLLSTGRRLTSLDRDGARRAIERCLGSRFTPLRIVALGVRTLVLLAFYQHPDVLAAMGVRWAERVEETIRLRAATPGLSDVASR